LLNNIGPGQKPDLLFFNSFLIAVVTSFLSLDLEYSVVFLVYAPILVISMMVLDLSSVGGEGARGLMSRVLKAGGAKAALALGVTMLVFLVWPRDFHRKGIFGDRLGRARGSFLDVDFSDEVSLDRSGPARASGRVVMRVRVQSGGAAGVPAHWRGATLSRFDGRDWKRRGLGTSEPTWHLESRGSWVRGERTEGARVTVDLVDPRAAHLFAPLRCRRLDLHPPANPRGVEALRDHTMVYARARDRRPVHYTLVLPRARTPSRALRPNPEHLALAPSSVPASARRLARLIRKGLPDDAPQHALVERMRRHLSERHEYLPPGAEGAARSLSEFISGKAGGHCEFFATGLVVLLRLERVPCRLVTGFRSEEWDEDGRTLTVRARHAHAWVEVLDPGIGWVTVDPSPASADFLAEDSGGPFAALRGLATKLWERVTSFDAEARLRALVWLRSAPGRLVGAAGRDPLPFSAIAALGAGLLALRWIRRRRRHPVAVREYLVRVRRAGLRPRPGETPRELLTRARRSAIRPRRLRTLEVATARHEDLRYGVKEEGPDGR
ncbi:MAG: transglutaminase TgpA family protein, partial [Planctomycetota bacterium]